MAALAKATSSGLPIAQGYTASGSASGGSSSIWILPIAYVSTALITAAKPTEQTGSYWTECGGGMGALDGEAARARARGRRSGGRGGAWRTHRLACRTKCYW